MSPGAEILYSKMACIAASRKPIWPLHQVWARDMEVSCQTIRRWVTELRNEGFIVGAKKRQHDGAVYFLQTAHSDRSDRSRIHRISTENERSASYLLSSIARGVLARVTESFGEYQLGGWFDGYSQQWRRPGILPDSQTIQRIADALGSLELCEMFEQRYGPRINSGAAKTWGLIVIWAREFGDAQRKAQGREDGNVALKQQTR